MLCSRRGLQAPSSQPSRNNGEHSRGTYLRAGCPAIICIESWVTLTASLCSEKHNPRFLENSKARRLINLCKVTGQWWERPELILAPSGANACTHLNHTQHPKLALDFDVYCFICLLLKPSDTCHCFSPSLRMHRLHRSVARALCLILTLRPPPVGRCESLTFRHLHWAAGRLLRWQCGQLDAGLHTVGAFPQTGFWRRSICMWHFPLSGSLTCRRICPRPKWDFTVSL